MPGGELRVDGARRLRSTLKAAGGDLDDLKAAHLDAAQVVVAAVLAPRRTGRLAGTIRAGATRRAAVVRAGTARVPYAGPIHWGWGRRHIRSNPFLTSAAQRTEAVWVGKYSDQLDTILTTIRGT